MDPNRTIESLEAAFLAEVERLIGIYGEVKVEAAFRQIIPDFNQQSPADTFELDKPTVPVQSEETPLMEVESLVFFRRAGRFFKNLFRKGEARKPVPQEQAPKGQPLPAPEAAALAGAGLAGAGGASSQ